jgi:hypothetical protein
MDENKRTVSLKAKIKIYFHSKIDPAERAIAAYNQQETVCDQSVSAAQDCLEKC